MKCPNCGDPNPDTAKFCQKCGKVIPASGVGAGVKLAALVGILVVGALLLMIALRGSRSSAPLAVSAAPGSHAGKTKLVVAFGTEKEPWLKWAVDEFAKTPAGESVDVDLVGLGSIEAAQAIVRGEKNINVWAPASSLYRDQFVKDWQDRRGAGAKPIAREASLALTPMVLVMWDERSRAFQSKLGEPNFKRIADAVTGDGWSAIAQKPEWGFFKFAHTDPGRSNSGLAALLLMASDYAGKSRDLSVPDVSGRDFQQWLSGVERRVVGASSGLTHSTGTLMTSMVQRGPSTYDCVVVYEANAIERLDQAAGRYGDLRVVYPPTNYWNDNPYYVIDAPWTSAEQQQAAKQFLDFLLSEPVQRQALIAHGFRPANLSVTTNGPDSPLVKHAAAGLRVDVPGTFVETPKGEVLESLLLAWQRARP
jgi:ABC-type molybdate transport system substrate-binding protein